MVDNSISVDSHVVLSASIDHFSERVCVPHSGLKFVADWLVEPIPRIHLSVFGVFKIKDGFLRREDFNSHVPCFSDHFALLGDFIIRPSEHLDDGSFLAIVVVTRLVYCGVVPNEIHIVQDQSSNLFAVIVALDSDLED